MNIIIPIGGKGNRFKLENYNEPKPLIKIFGKQMIFHLIDNLKINDLDKLIVIYNKELNNFNFNILLKNRYPNIILIELNKQTDGAVETILFGLNLLNNNLLKNKTIILDCDTFYKTDILSIFRNQIANSIFYIINDNILPIYSYIKFNSNNIITEIKEKEKISDYANTGCYCFENGTILKQYCNQIINNNIRYNNEYYMSCVINEMITNNHIFYANNLNNYDVNCVGTPLQLKIYCSNIINDSNDKKRFCFDLDNTLVTSPEIKNDYTTVKPIIKNIEILKLLKSLGHTIIIYTARRMRTHNGNTGLIIKDIGYITLNTLEQFKIPYDELFFGKPYADFYIDDLAVNCYQDLEKQLGYYKTNINERYFNDIKTDKLDIIIKKSNNIDIIEGEIYYYNNIPLLLKKYFPLFITSGLNWYRLEKINCITLSYLFVNESLTDDLFIKLLNIFNEIHNFDNTTDNNLNIYTNYKTKIKLRYSEFNYNSIIDDNNDNINNIYNYLITYFENYENNNLGKNGIIHGDAVFSNCLFNNIDNNYKLIDMRGKLDNTLSIYGDIFYDYGKIYQSLIGYDEILIDKYVSNDYKNNLINIFNNYITNKYGEQYIKIIKNITNSLLFSLIPLHNNIKCNQYYKLINIIN
jgi:capsule biosynthesis phosphatase